MQKTEQKKKGKRKRSHYDYDDGDDDDDSDKKSSVPKLLSGIKFPSLSDLDRLIDDRSEIKQFEHACNSETSIERVKRYDEYRYMPVEYKDVKQDADQEQLCRKLALLSVAKLTPGLIYEAFGKRGQSYVWFDYDADKGGCRLDHVDFGKKRYICGHFGKHNRSFFWYDSVSDTGVVRKAVEDDELECSIVFNSDTGKHRLWCSNKPSSLVV